MGKECHLSQIFVSPYSNPYSRIKRGSGKGSQKFRLYIIFSMYNVLKTIFLLRYDKFAYALCYFQTKFEQNWLLFKRH